MVNDLTTVEQRLDGVGDLEFPSLGRFEVLDRLVNRRVEEVHADERKVGRGIVRLFDESDHTPFGIDVGDAERRRIVDLGQEDLGGRCTDRCFVTVW